MPRKCVPVTSTVLLLGYDVLLPKNAWEGVYYSRAGKDYFLYFFSYTGTSAGLTLQARCSYALCKHYGRLTGTRLVCNNRIQYTWYGSYTLLFLKRNLP